ncbi:MAG: hypothetical protein BMS9Abin02_1045 [Anaerolineae bacterium]|nr:MAG: hypothetical protein BMS9Abin02_1045 [Anaerolineae bacterium]
MIRRRLLQLTIPLIGAFLLLSAIFFFFATFGASRVAANGPVYGVAIGPDSQAQTADAGDTITYTYWVSNTGVSTDTYTITAANELGWPTAVSPVTVTITSQISDTVVLTIEVDSAAPAGPAITTITATSSSPILLTDFSTNTTTVNAVLDVDIEKDETGSADPGTTAVYTHTVTNTGNKGEKFNFTASSAPLYDTQVSPTSLTLNKDEVGVVTVEIDIPSTAGSIVEVKTTVTATADTDANVKDSVIDTTAVNQVYAVKIVKNESSTALPGDTVVYEHTVTNMGNGTDTFNITAVSNQGFTTTVPDPIVLGRGLSKKIEVSVKIPAGAAAGLIDKMTVTATSTGDGSKSDSVVDTTTVAEVFSVDIKKNESGSADPGATAVYTHTVTNQGNGREKFNLSATSNQGFATRVVPSSLTLNKGASGLVRVEIDISESADSTIDDKTTVTAASGTDANVKDSVIDTTTINRHRLLIPLVSTSTEWNQVGANSWTDGDEATSADVCPSDSDLIFAGTEDALRLFDGNSWTTLTGDVPKDGIISSIVMNDSCNAVYVVVFKGSKDPIIGAHGVWEGTLSDQGKWLWQELTGGVDVTFARKVALSEGTLFAGGGFGIAYWASNRWNDTGVSASPSEPIMDISVANGLKNEGPLYAVKWLEKKVYRNTNPGINPGDWALITGLDDIPDNGWVRSVAGDSSSVRYVGTTRNLYGLSGKSWGLIKEQQSRTVLIKENVYAGFAGNITTGEVGDGVYISTDQGANFSPYNEGWKPPQTVYVLVDNPDYLFVATSAGVFRR